MTDPSWTDEWARFLNQNGISVYVLDAYNAQQNVSHSRTLERAAAVGGDDKDERHIAPLQLQVIARALELWTNPNDVVLSPFAGIGSEIAMQVIEHCFDLLCKAFDHILGQLPTEVSV